MGQRAKRAKRERRRAPPGAALFRRFLEENRQGAVDAGKALGVTHQAICLWRDKNVIPTAENRVAIETWTGGKVPASSWRVAAAKSVTPFSPPDSIPQSA